MLCAFPGFMLASNYLKKLLWFVEKSFKQKKKSPVSTTELLDKLTWMSWEISQPSNSFLCNKGGCTNIEITQQEEWMRMWQIPFSSHAPEWCQNCHFVFSLTGEHSCSAGRWLLAHTGGRWERGTPEETRKRGEWQQWKRTGKERDPLLWLDRCIKLDFLPWEQ